MFLKQYSKSFVFVVIGQIISLFGNALVRFALPLYLLNQTGSSALFGTVIACAFLPAVLMSPIGGMIADRVNKRNIMVGLDFFTALVILGFLVWMENGNLLLLLTVTLMLLYGIAGAYQPTVQASIPVLVSEEQLVTANAVINTVSSLAALLGPVLGGILYSTYGLKPVLWVCMVSAFMEIFIQIPVEKQPVTESIFQTVKTDFSESIRFICRENPDIGKGMLVVWSVNLFLSAMIIVGLPYMITEVMDFLPEQANRLYGVAEGIMAAGGLAGGVGAGIFANRLKLQKAGNLLIVFGGCVLPMGAVHILHCSEMFRYAVMTVCCFCIMALSTVFTVQMMSFIQAKTPKNLLGKVIAVILTFSMCAQPIGSALYGILFEAFKGAEYAVILFAGFISLGIAVGTRGVFKNMKFQ